MNPAPVIRTVLTACRDWVQNAPRLVLGALPGAVLALVLIVVGVFAFQVLQANTQSLGGLQKILLAVSVLVWASLVWVALSWVWLTVDRVLFSDQRWIDNFFTGVGAVLLVALPMIGLTFITWILLLSLAPRLGGPQELEMGALWPPGEERAYLLVCLGVIILAAPMLLRLYYAVCASAIEESAAKESWKIVVRTTKGKTLPLLLGTLPQGALLALIAYLIAPHLGDGLELGALVAILLSALLLTLSATMQVSVARHYLGLYQVGQSVEEKDFVVPPSSVEATPHDAPEKPTVEAGTDSSTALPPLPDALRPQSEQASSTPASPQPFTPQEEPQPFTPQAEPQSEHTQTDTADPFAAWREAAQTSESAPVERDLPTMPAPSSPLPPPPTPKPAVSESESPAEGPPAPPASPGTNESEQASPDAPSRPKLPFGDE